MKVGGDPAYGPSCTTLEGKHDDPYNAFSATLYKNNNPVNLASAPCSNKATTV